MTTAFKIMQRYKNLVNVISSKTKHNSLFATFRHRFSTNVCSVKLAFTAHGETNSLLPPIVISHGIFGSRVNWHSIGKAIAKQTQRQVFCLDARNHGHSPHTSEMTYFHMAADIKSFICDHCSPSAVVIGHSMGGRASMVLALTEPSVVDRLVIVDISPTRCSPKLNEMGGYFKALSNLKLPAGLSLSEARKAADNKLALDIKDPRIRQFLLMNIENVESDGSIAWRINLEALTANFKIVSTFPELKDSKFDGPTLFIAGELSDYLGPQDMPGILSTFPTARLETVPKANHWVHADNPSYFIKIVTEYLKS